MIDCLTTSQQENVLHHHSESDVFKMSSIMYLLNYISSQSETLLLLLNLLYQWHDSGISSLSLCSTITFHATTDQSYMFANDLFFILLYIQCPLSGNLRELHAWEGGVEVETSVQYYEFTTKRSGSVLYIVTCKFKICRMYCFLNVVICLCEILTDT